MYDLFAGNTRSQIVCDRSRLLLCLVAHRPLPTHQSNTACPLRCTRLSNFCPTIVQTLSIIWLNGQVGQMLDKSGIFVQCMSNWHGPWYMLWEIFCSRTKCGQIFDFLKSWDCPSFVQVQCDQMPYVKIIKSNIWPSVVLWLFGEFRPIQRTKKGHMLGG